MEEEQKIFKRGSTAYYYSSRFFSKKVREDVYRLYCFVYTASGYVNNKPAETKKLLALEKAYLRAVNDVTFDAIAHKWDDIDTRAIKHIVRLQNKYKFDFQWVKAFFDSMKMDVEGKKYSNLDDTLKYVHGSAEVIALMMAKILKLPDEADEAAMMQGRAMQWLNFIRNIEDDNKRGRSYFPSQELKKYGLKDLTRETAKYNPDKFKKFINSQLKQYSKWQNQAQKGMQYVPERSQVPIKTAVDMYAWMARRIEASPLVIYEKKIKPRKRQVVRRVIQNTARGTARVTVRTGRQAKTQVKRIRPAAKAAYPKIKSAPQTVKTKSKELKDKIIE